MAIDKGWIYCRVAWYHCRTVSFPSLYRNCWKWLLKFCNSMKARKWKGELSLKRSLAKCLEMCTCKRLLILWLFICVPSKMCVCVQFGD